MLIVKNKSFWHFLRLREKNIASFLKRKDYCSLRKEYGGTNNSFYLVNFAQSM
jgi:hypothetical protein